MTIIEDIEGNNGRQGSGTVRSEHELTKHDRDAHDDNINTQQQQEQQQQQERVMQQLAAEAAERQRAALVQLQV